MGQKGRNISAKEPCIPAKEPRTSAKESYKSYKSFAEESYKSFLKNPTRAQYSIQRALYSIKILLWKCRVVGILHFHKRAQSFTRQKSDISAKEPYVSAKEPNILSKEACCFRLLQKSPAICISAKEPHIPTTESIVQGKKMSKQLCTLVLIVCIFFFCKIILCVPVMMPKKNRTLVLY